MSTSLPGKKGGEVGKTEKVRIAYAGPVFLSAFALLCGSAQEATVKAPAESTSGEVPLPGSRTSVFVSSRGRRSDGFLLTQESQEGRQR